MSLPTGWKLRLENHEGRLYTHIFKAQISASAYEFQFNMSPGPTGNCQLTSIAYMNYVLCNCRGEKQRENVRTMLREAYALAKRQPRMVFFDLEYSFYNEFKNCFYETEIINEKRYESTNGSSMVMFLLKFPNGL
jgi:hypothetical protein